jgi:hypothetical protein
MKDDKNLREDLSYVRDVVDRAQGDSANPASIYFLWAVIAFFGYAIIDFAPEQTGFYWMIAGPAGGVLSGVLGQRAARRAGRISARSGLSEALHWTALMVSILLLIPLATTGALDPAELPRIILLLVAMAYFMAGVHLDRKMLPIGAVLALCYLLTLSARDLPYLWTLTATILAASLALGGILAARGDRERTAA